MPKVEPAGLYNNYVYVEATNLIARKQYGELSWAHLGQIAIYDPAGADKAAELRERAKAAAKNADAAPPARPKFVTWSELGDVLHDIAGVTKDVVKRPLEEKVAALQKRLDELEQRPPAGVKWSGIFTEGVSYGEGALCTRGGCLWLAMRPTTEKPGNSSRDWKLVVKSGNAPQE